MKKHLIISALCFFVLSGCNINETKEEETTTPIPSGQNQCQKSSDCETPMEFLVQSNCPFGSACVENTCKVVCPILNFDQTAEPKTFPSQCKDKSDCNCAERGERTKECLCIEGGCYSVEG